MLPAHIKNPSSSQNSILANVERCKCKCKSQGAMMTSTAATRQHSSATTLGTRDDHPLFSQIPKETPAPAAALMHPLTLTLKHVHTRRAGSPAVAVQIRPQLSASVSALRSTDVQARTPVTPGPAPANSRVCRDDTAPPNRRRHARISALTLQSSAKRKVRGAKPTIALLQRGVGVPE